ncbi:MAG: hypothetical protein HYY01_15400, partial [Chloroflexi bacterium]|nr:hypothetical protein [Chloroflexota bacterium]
MKTTTWMTRTTAFVMVALLVLSGLSAALSPAFAARADGETVNFALVPTAAAPGAFGQGTLTLRSDAAGQELEATANAVGLPPSRHITLCLTDPSGNTLLLDKDDDRKDNETSVSLRQKLFVSFTTLLGVTVSIRQSPSSDKCEGTVLLSY